MKVQIIEEHGYSSALVGLSLSYNQDPARPLQQSDFEHPIPKERLQHLNEPIADEQ